MSISLSAPLNAPAPRILSVGALAPGLAAAGTVATLESVVKRYGKTEASDRSGLLRARSAQRNGAALGGARRLHAVAARRGLDYLSAQRGQHLK